MREEKLYLLHILECIQLVEEYTAGNPREAMKNRKTTDAVLRNLQTMSESTTRLSPESKAKHPEINWTGIAGFRNVVAHDYLGVSIPRVAEIIEENLPELRQAIEDLLRAAT